MQVMLLYYYKKIMNKYQVIDVIDEGAYGIVLKALNKETNKLVAIKKFKEGDQDEVVRKNIQREIKMLKTLKSQYVVDLKEAFKRKGKVYLIFEYMQKNLLNLIEEHENGLPPQIIRSLIYQLFKGLKFLHSKDIIHRDIKPENLLLSSGFKLKICDFGFTRVVSNLNQELTDYVATRWYRAPELLVGQKYNNAIDVWAVGCIMGELLDGQPLFPGQNQIDQLYLIKKMLGELTHSQMERFSKNQRFIGLKFPDIRKYQSLDSKYIGKIDKYALDFLKECLKVDPKARITASNAFNHPYFSTFHPKLNQKHEEQEYRIISEKKSKSKIAHDMKTDTSSNKMQQFPNLKSIYNNTKNKGFYNTIEEIKIKNEIIQTKSNNNNNYHLPKAEDSKKQKKNYHQSIEQNLSTESNQLTVNLNMKLNINLLKEKQKQKNLPKIKQKHRLLHSKISSQPIMLQTKTNRMGSEQGIRLSTIYNNNTPPLNLGVLGHSKSILKFKKI